MIAARVIETGDGFAARLEARARRIAEAALAARLLAGKGRGEGRWRDARLLWPLFGDPR